MIYTTLAAALAIAAATDPMKCIQQNCASQLSACQADSTCNAGIQCVEACVAGDASCEKACINKDFDNAMMKVGLCAQSHKCLGAVMPWNADEVEASPIQAHADEVEASPIQAPGACEQHKDCHSCIEVDPTNNCGYCRDPVTASTPASGNRCVDINEKYNCPSDFWTDKCEVGYTCNMTTLQCTQSAVRPDYKTMADCQTSCVTQPPPPPTPSPAPVSPTPIGPPPPPTPARYQCQVVHNAPQCSTCQPGGNATSGCAPAQLGAIRRNSARNTSQS